MTYTCLLGGLLPLAAYLLGYFGAEWMRSRRRTGVVKRHDVSRETSPVHTDGPDHPWNGHTWKCRCAHCERFWATPETGGRWYALWRLRKPVAPPPATHRPPAGSGSGHCARAHDHPPHSWGMQRNPVYMYCDGKRLQ